MKILSYVTNLALISISCIIPSFAAKKSGIPQELQVQPFNDDCITAKPIIFDDNGFAKLIGESNIGALPEDESVPDCDFAAPREEASNGVWYSFSVKGGPKKITATTYYQRDFDTEIIVYQGSCDELTCLQGQGDYRSRNFLNLIIEPEIVTGAKNTNIYIFVRGLLEGWGSYIGQGVFNLTVTIEDAYRCSNNCQKHAASLCKEALSCSGFDDENTMGECIQHVCRDM